MHQGTVDIDCWMKLPRVTMSWDFTVLEKKMVGIGLERVATYLAAACVVAIVVANVGGMRSGNVTVAAPSGTAPVAPSPSKALDKTVAPEGSVADSAAGDDAAYVPYPPCAQPFNASSTDLKCEIPMLVNATITNKLLEKKKRWQPVITCGALLFRREDRGSLVDVAFRRWGHVGPTLYTDFFHSNVDWITGNGFLRAQQLPYPGDGAVPSSAKHFKYGIVMPEVTCLANLWHGMFETVVPLYDLLNRVGIIEAARRGEVALLTEFPRPNGWATLNIGCPSRNVFPFGLNYTTYVGRMLFEMFGIDPETTVKPGRGFGDIVFSYGDLHRSLMTPNHFRGHIFVSKLIVGIPRTCTPFFVSTIEKYFPAWPFYGPTSQHPHAAYCAELLESFRHSVLAQRKTVSETEWDKPVSKKERLCPRVVFVKRVTRANGRGIANEAEVLESLHEALREHCPKGGYTLDEVWLERLSLDDQMKLMLNTTVMVAARGAGLVNSLFMRPGSMLHILSIYDRSKAVEDDNYPFYPFISFAPRRHIGFTNCQAQREQDPMHACNAVTVNFCDMKCQRDSVKRGFAMLLGQMLKGADDKKEGTLYSREPVVPRVRLDASGRHYYTGDEF